MSTNSIIAGAVQSAPRGEWLDLSLARPRILWTGAAAGALFSGRTALAMVTARWLHAGSEPGVAVGFFLEFVLLLIAALHAAGRAETPLAKLARVPCVRWVAVFLAFSCASLAWSGTASRAASFLYWCGMASDVAIVVLLLRALPVVEVAHSVMTGFVTSSCVLAVVAWMLPVTVDLRLGDPDYFNTNQIANLCAMGVFMAQMLAGRRERRWRLAAWLLALTLLRSLSKATLAAFVISQAVLLLRDTTTSRRRKALVISVALVATAASWGLFESYYAVYTTSSNQAETLTGRTGIWLYSLNAALEKPWLGNGMDSMWKVVPPFGGEMFEPRHAENELLQQFYSYGLAGVAMLIAVYGSLLRGIRRMARGRTRTVLLCMMIYIVIRGLAEAEPFDLLMPLWMIVLAGAIAETGKEVRT